MVKTNERGLGSMMFNGHSIMQKWCTAALGSSIDTHRDQIGRFKIVAHNGEIYPFSRGFQDKA